MTDWFYSYHWIDGFMFSNKSTLDSEQHFLIKDKEFQLSL